MRFLVRRDGRPFCNWPKGLNTETPTRITPMTKVRGAASIIVAAMATSIWTCCTSLVMRVMSDAAPKWPTSRAE